MYFRVKISVTGCRAITTVGVLLLLAACGGSGGSSSGAPEGPSAIDQLRFMENYHTNQRRLNARAAQAGTLTMPSSGTASYEGVARHVHRPDPAGSSKGQVTMFSPVVMVADLESGELEGVMGDFRREDARSVDGLVRIENGTIAGGNIVADVSGRMTVDGSRRDIAGSLDGQFVGPDAAGMSGTYIASSNDGALWGTIGAERVDN